jgi:phytoene synthase
MVHFENSYCGKMVKEQDPDRYLLSHFAPADRRQDLWALFAFNYEIAKTREIVSETQLGLIRLQWWREAVEKIYKGEILEHEGIEALARAIKTHNLPKDLFDALIYAREFDLEDVRPSTLEGLLHYADYTSTPLMTLALMICGDDHETDPVQVVAVNYALAGVVRATISFAKQRRSYLPEDLMNAHAVSMNTLFDLKKQDGLPEILRIISDEFVGGVKCESRFLKASQHLAKIYNGQLKKLGYDVFDGRSILPPAFKELRLFLNL